MERPGTIFVLTPVSRSGSNFGRMLVCQHSQVRPTAIHEDFLLLHSGCLQEYANSCHRTRGEQSWSNHHELLALVAKAALKSIRQKIPDEFVVASRSPTVKGLPNLPFFPGARALVIVRDPRDCAESAQISFGRSLEYVTQLWLQNMHIVERMRIHPLVSVFRYEDILQGVVKPSQIFESVGLVAEEVAVSNLPVLGSSDLVRAGGSLHWQPVPLTKEFSPIGRWKMRAEFWQDFVENRPDLANHMKMWGYE